MIVFVAGGADGGPVGHAGGRGVARAARRHLRGRGEGGLVRMRMVRLLLQGQPHRAVPARGRGGGEERRQTQRLLVLVDLVTCNYYVIIF